MCVLLLKTILKCIFQMVECTLWEQLQARRQRNQINSILSCIFWFLFSRRMVSVVIVRVRWKSENKSSLLADTSFGGLFEHSSRYLMSFAFTDQRSHGRHQLFLWFTQLWIFTEKYSAFPVTSINLRHFFLVWPSIYTCNEKTNIFFNMLMHGLLVYSACAVW